MARRKDGKRKAYASDFSCHSFPHTLFYKTQQRPFQSKKMTGQRFFMELGLIVVVSIVITLAMPFIEQLAPYQHLGMYCIVFFTAMAIVMYFIGDRIAKSSNLSLYSNFSLFYGFMKMALVVLLLILAKKLISFENNYFAVPFLVLYFLFVVFETRVLMKLGNPKLNTE